MMNHINTALKIAAIFFPFATVSAQAETPIPVVKSAEFQFGQPFASPQRVVASNKMATLDGSNLPVPLTVKNTQLAEKKWPSKNRESQGFIDANSDFWIYDSWTTLSHDYDYDGYYSKLTVEFDADTVFSRAYVYAVIYLGIDGVFDAIHTTSVFAIDGDSSNDSFVVESELVSGFPSNDYEVLIELYDADYDEFIAFSDGLDDEDLAFTPLESEEYEVVTETRVVIVDEHGGSTSLLSVIILLALTFTRALLKRETH
ncbi:choice-of-anchor H family protein [Alteromonas facilis]|uniref:choice-of-anchor H family protein n=1 Tax=Alteromonas facilis TaxID=2048004 RepID=UPI000C28F9CC|nr:choice-of-anchor H family protein [Alteromonas facilis]